MKKRILLATLTLTTGHLPARPDHTASRKIGLAAEVNDCKGIEKELANGGNINFQNNAAFHQTPLMAACQHDNLEAAQELITKGANVNLQDEDERTALTYTALSKNHGKAADIAQALIDAGASVTLTDNLKKTPLEHAFEEGNLPVAIELLQAKISNKKLIKRAKAAFENAKEKAQKNYPALYNKIKSLLNDL